MLSSAEAHRLPFSDLDWGSGPRSKLGEGSFGTVFKATLRGTHQVAVKTMRVSRISPSELVKFKSELIIMAPLKHPNASCYNTAEPAGGSTREQQV